MSGLNIVQRQLFHARYSSVDKTPSHRGLKPRPHQQQCRSNVRICCRNVNNVGIVFFRDYSCSICFDYVERILRLVAFDNVASILLLVWTELYTKQRLLSARRPRRMHTCDSVLPLFASRCGVCSCVPCTMYYRAQH